MLLLDLRGEEILIHPDRALWHPRSRTLFVADLHLGKSSAFREAGIPVPETTSRTLARLSACIDNTRANRLVILGDLLHAPTGRTPPVMSAVTAWRESRTQLDISLIRGNHDLKSGDPPPSWRFNMIVAPITDTLTPFALAHAPEELNSASFGLCGHLHPALPLATIDRFHASRRRSAPCLWITPTHAVLPAFGDFTGGYRIAPSESDRIILFIDGELVDVPRRRARC